MADDPWSAFPVVQAATAPAAPASTPSGAPAPTPDGGPDPWAAFPVVQAAGQGGDAPSTPAADPKPAPTDHGSLYEKVRDALPYVNGLVRSAANSVPVLGAYADKLDAATDSAISGKSADQAMADQKAQDATFATQNPVASGAAGFAGAAGGSVAMLPEAGLGMVGTLGQRVAGAAAGGAALGAADNAARGDSATSGALVGGAGGALGPLIGTGAGAAYRGVTGLMQGAPASLPNTGRIAAAWLRDGVADMTPESYAAAKDAVGPSGMFMEASPKLQDYAGSVADNNSAGKAVVRGALDDRFAGRDGRVNNLVNQNLGPVPNPTDLEAGWKGQVDELGRERADMLASADPVDATPAVRTLQNARSQFAPASQEQGALSRALDWTSVDRNPTAVSTWERDPVGSGETPEMPDNLPTPPPYTDQAAPSRPGPVGVPRPMDLHSFVRSLGGIQDRGGDLAAMGYDNLVARPNQGLGADAMRQAAAQMGYLNHAVDGTSDGATRFSTVNDLLDALGSDNPIYSANDEDAVHAWAARDAAMQDYQQRGGGDPLARNGGPQSSTPGLPFSGDPGYDPNAAPVRMALTDPTQLHSAKQQFDKAVKWNSSPFADPNASIGFAEAPYKTARYQVNEALRDQVPGYAGNQDAQRSIFAQQKALTDGRADLAPNADPARYPPTFAQTFDTLPKGAPEGSLPAIQDARRAGQRFSVEASLGNRENDFQATRQLLQGDEGWNRQNLGKVFGQEPVGNVAQGLDQEKQMAANRQRIAGGSPTGEKVQRSRLTQPGGQSEGVTGLMKDWWNDLYIDKPSTYLPTDKIAGRIMAGAYERARGQIAPHLVKTGPEADALFQLLLAQRQRQATLAPPNTDPLIRALAGANQYARQGLMGQ